MNFFLRIFTKIRGNLYRKELYWVRKFPNRQGRIPVLSGTTDVKEWHETKKENMHIWFWSTLFRVGVNYGGPPVGGNFLRPCTVAILFPADATTLGLIGVDSCFLFHWVVWEFVSCTKNVTTSRLQSLNG